MKIEKERNSIKITYSACASPERIMEIYDAIGVRVAGIYLPSDVQRGKEGITLNIRHRESIQAYFEKNIFRIDDFIRILRKIKEITAALSENGYDPGNCLWDVDAVFVGGSISELEVVYLAEHEDSELVNNTLTDLLAVMSLHVFDSRDSAIEALSDAVNEFAAFERSGPENLPGEEQFERAIDLLANFSSGTGRVRRLMFCLWNKIKKALQVMIAGTVSKESKKSEEFEESRGSFVNGADIIDSSDENESGTGALMPVPEGSSDAAAGSETRDLREERIFLTSAADSAYLEYVVAEKKFKKRRNGVFGLESRLIKLDEAGPVKRTAVIDAGPRRNKSCEEYHLNRDYLVRRAGLYCPFVSRRHAKLIKKGGEYIISDSDSLNGTYLNGDRLTPGAYYRVVNGDVISLAHVSMSFEFCA